MTDKENTKVTTTDAAPDQPATHENPYLVASRRPGSKIRMMPATGKGFVILGNAPPPKIDKPE